MELALISFHQILTLVLLMLVGIGCGKIKLIDEETNKKLSNLLLLLINPVLIFLSYQRDFERELLNGLMLAMLLSVISFLLAITVSQLLYKNKKGKDFALEKFGMVYTNAGFLGIPLVNGVFGSEGVFYLTGYLTVFFLFFWTHGVIVMSGKKEITAIKKAFISPPMLAIFAGFLFFILRIEIPQTIYTPLRLLGNINTPLAMLVAGVSIFGTNFVKLLGNKRIYTLCFLRLLLLPALTILVFSPFSFPTVILGTIVILSSCPIAANIILFAYRYDRDSLYASEVFAATTVLSLVTIPLILILL